MICTDNLLKLDGMSISAQCSHEITVMVRSEHSLEFWCISWFYIIKSSRNGVSNGSFMSPEATRNDNIHIGRINRNTPFKICFPAEPEEEEPSVRSRIHSPVSRSFFSTDPSLFPIEFDKIESNRVLLCSEPLSVSLSRKTPAPMARSISATEGFGWVVVGGGDWVVVLLIVSSWGLRLERGGRGGTDTEVFLLLLLLLGVRTEKIMGVLVIA